METPFLYWEGALSVFAVTVRMDEEFMDEIMYFCLESLWKLVSYFESECLIDKYILVKLGFEGSSIGTPKKLLFMQCYQAPAVNLLVIGRCGCNFKCMVFEHILWIDIWSTHHEISLRWMPTDHTGDKSIPVQVMALCHLASSHYLNQCLPRSIMWW